MYEIGEAVPEEGIQAANDYCNMLESSDRYVAMLEDGTYAIAAVEQVQADAMPPSAEQVVAAILEAEPALTDKLPGAIVGRLGSWFDEWSGDGVGYVAGKLLNRSGVLYRVLQGHTSQPDWTPESAPSLFARVLTDPGGDILPWEQPGSTNPYMRGDRVTFDGKTWESTIDNNVWSPADYPAGWVEIGG